MSLLAELQLSCEYQPLIDAQHFTIFGYEALSRFKQCSTPISTSELFKVLHDQPAQLQQLEYCTKQFQINHAPKEQRLFVNIDPHAIPTEHLSVWADLLQSHPKLTIEIIENDSSEDATLAIELVKYFSPLGIDIALDDVGAPDSMLSTLLLTQVNLLKFDRHWLSLSNDLHSMNLLRHLIQFAHATGKKTVLEGIETQAHLLLAQSMGIDLVQGFLFKPQFIHASEYQAFKQVNFDALNTCCGYI